MAVTLTPPETGIGELSYSFPILKFSRDEDGDLVVSGVATDGSVDSDRQIVDEGWSAKALEAWHGTGSNVRMSHDPRRPIGKGLRVDIDRDGDGKHWVRSVVVDKDAQRLIEKGVLTAYSVGISNPVIKRDPSGHAPGGIICGGEIAELSIVDRRANKSAYLQIAKAAGDGHMEFTGTVFGAEAVTEDAEPKTQGKGVTVTLPKNMSLSVKPSDLAKLATFKQRLVQDQAVQPEITKTAEPEVEKGVLRDSEREGMPAGDFAYVDPEGGKHLPVHDEGHVRSALGRFAQQHFGSPAARKKAAKKIVSRARSMGIDLGDHGTVVVAAGGKTKVAKTANPQAEKKMKVMCPSCGAKQNKKHAACSECGRPLANAMAVAKNHDFTCLGCGKDPLDKGEKFCPDCGTANPGHNPMADKKLPMNEDKTAEAAVTKAKKKKPKKAKGKPFGGAQAAPFGDKREDAADDGDGKGKDDAKPKASKKAARVTKGSQSKGKKGKGGKKPTPASAGGVPGSHTDPVPAHREPDGGAVEALEADAGLEDGDGMEAQSKVPVMAGVKTADPEMAASLALKALDVPADLGALHALTCPAYAPADVAKAFPHAAFSGVDEGWWQGEALSKAASAPLGEATAAMELWNAARALKQADPYLTQDLREAAHKAFRDANPGPSSFPTPGELSPQRFNRPLISEGHEAPSPGHDAPHSVRLPASGGISAGNYQRGYLDAGHASDGPGNQHTPGPAAAPAATGAPTHDPAQGYVTHMAHDSASHAIGAMHDHISRIFPDVCPMNPGDNDFRNPVPSPTGGVTPAPGARKAAKATAKKAAAKAKRKAAKAAKAEKAKTAAMRRKLERLVMKGRMTVDEARAQAGLPPVTKGADPGPIPVEPVVPDVTEAIKKATAPLAAALKKANKTAARQGKELRKVRKTADAIASQPDTSGAPFRGVALNKTSAPPVEAPTPAGTAEQAQLHKMRLLQQEALNSPDPGRRVAAWAELDHLLGIAPDMTPQYIPLRQ